MISLNRGLRATLQSKNLLKQAVGAYVLLIFKQIAPEIPFEGYLKRDILFVRPFQHLHKPLIYMKKMHFLAEINARLSQSGFQVVVKDMRTY